MKPTGQSVVSDILEHGGIGSTPSSMGEICHCITEVTGHEHYAYTLVLALKLLVTTGELKASGLMLDAYSTLYSKPQA